MSVISVEQLASSAAKLIAEAESGQVSIVTKNGQPLFLAVPYDKRLADEDAHVTIAIRLYEQDVVSVGKAAKIAGLSLGEFIERLGALKIPVIRYPVEDLERELREFG